jgi:hypothetical protein
LFVSFGELEFPLCEFLFEFLKANFALGDRLFELLFKFLEAGFTLGNYLIALSD